jgi:hypothetical protein
MVSKIVKTGTFTLTAYAGDAKTLLAFDLGKADTKNLAGFTIQCEPPGGQPYYLLNTLQFASPDEHAQDSSQPEKSSINAPFQKFRWLHVPGSAHQGIAPPYGSYGYTVTPRSFNASGALEPLDPALSATVRIDVQPFVTGKLALGFTRGYVQSQAFAHHFGRDALIVPKAKTLQYDTGENAGANAQGQQYTYLDEYQWLGYTARAHIFDILNEVLGDSSLSLDMFAYDLSEPDIVGLLLKLAAQGRIRIILDNASLHHASPPKAEDQFEALFRKAAKKNAAILRGKFGRFAHDKVLIVSKGSNAVKVLTGSTNFSSTGLYVNANHVLVFDDATVAGTYADVFQESWNDGVSKTKFAASPYANKTFAFASGGVPKTSIAFSPHTADVAASLLDGMAQRIEDEGKKSGAKASVLFAVMQMTGSSGPVLPALAKLHSDENIFTYGISDSPGGTALYAPGRPGGVLVTGKPGPTTLLAPFDQVASIGGWHEIHHKFVVCGFNTDDAVVYCGSSNLAAGGEAANGDNLIAVHDQDAATAFAIEAVALVDHFDFLDRFADKAGTKKSSKPRVKKSPVSKSQAAASVQWFLHTDSEWTASYYDPKDLHCMDRQVFSLA